MTNIIDSSSAPKQSCTCFKKTLVVERPERPWKYRAAFCRSSIEYNFLSTSYSSTED